MLTLTTESGAAHVPFRQHAAPDALRSYRLELSHDLLDEQGQVIDWLIGFAFDTLGTDTLELRVRPAEYDFHQ